MNPDLSIALSSGSARFNRKQRLWAGWTLLIAGALFLAGRIHCGTTEDQAASLLLPELRISHWMISRAGALFLGALREFASFVPVGVGAAVLLPAGSGGRRFPIRLRAPAAGSALAAPACVVTIAGSCCLVTAFASVFPLLGSLCGVWAGVTWRRGRRARLLLVPKAALPVLLAVLGAGIILWSSLEDRPLPLETASASSAERQRVTHLIRSKSPTSLREGQTHTLRLTEHDANLLLSRGSSANARRLQVAVRLRQDSFVLLMSLPVRLRAEEPRYLNVEMAARAAIEDTVLRLHVDRCRVGSRELPRWLPHSLGRLAGSWLNHDQQAKPFLQATRKLTIAPDLIQLTYGPVDMSAMFRGRLLRSSVASAELLASTRTQVDHLLLLFAGSPTPDGAPSFNLCLKTAFALARDRSAQGDAVTENRAALLALGILLGHPGIEDFLGPVVDDGNREEAQKIVNRVVLHGRLDWTRHFCASAGIAILSDEAVSDACGSLKEELDADPDGSGFSFADLLANRAGMALAGRATRDEAAARSMQDRLARGFHVEEVCPPPGDLPEGVSEADLQSRYGGVGGEGYRRLIKDIEQRVAACAAYR